MWKEFFGRIGRSKTNLAPSESSDTSNSSSSYGGAGVTGRYSFRNSSSCSFCSQEGSLHDAEGTEEEEEELEEVEEEDTNERWREKFEFVLSLMREPRYLLSDTLVAEQLKLTLKLQAYRLEQVLLHQSIDEAMEQTHGPTEHRDMESFQKQLLQINRKLGSLQTQLEVLKAVQQAVPSELTASGGISDSEEADSLEPKAIASQVNSSGTSRSGQDKEAHSKDAINLLALLRLERLARKNTRRDLESLRKHYQRLKEELEWRDSGHGDDVDVADESDSEMIGSNADSNVTLKNWTWLTENRKSGARARRRKFHESAQNVSGEVIDNTSLEQLAMHGTAEHFFKEVQTARIFITKLTTRLEQLESDIQTSRVENDRLMEANISLQRKNEELLNTVRDLTASIQESSTHKMEPMNEPVLKTFVSNDENIQRKRTYKVNEKKEVAHMRNLIAELEQKEMEYKAQIDTLTKMAHHDSQLPNLEELEGHIHYMEQQLELKDKEISAVEQYAKTKVEENALLKLDLQTLHEEYELLKLELDHRQNGRLDGVIQELNAALDANKRLTEDINRERVLRKKYFNAIEVLKGKIRVYCRLRPLSYSERMHSGTASIADVVDPYTLIINTAKGPREFNFDRVFLPHDSQETVFQDTCALVQSAFDGYNVCICAYGQTGSGKTHTIIGDDEQPGLALRTFQRIFQLVEENVTQFDISVSIYMLELYNDRLIDLIRGNRPEVKLEIKKDKQGIVWVQGSHVAPIASAEMLLDVFRQGLHSRHTGSTQMNDRSSRSHLIVGINIECVSRLHGTVTHGKVSLLDLAGSERLAKSGASPDQQREASSINKSLSTLGDVISALSSDKSFVPYRNSKLTMLMQDCLGGNAKTLLFVTASTAAYNLEETLTSLTYASRAKEVTNAAQRHADSREIARLKSIISKLRREEDIHKEQD